MVTDDQGKKRAGGNEYGGTTRRKRPTLTVMVLGGCSEDTNGGVRLWMKAESREGCRARVDLGRMKEVAQRWARLGHWPRKKAETLGGCARRWACDESVMSLMAAISPGWGSDLCWFLIGPTNEDLSAVIKIVVFQWHSSFSNARRVVGGLLGRLLIAAGPVQVPFPLLDSCGGQFSTGSRKFLWAKTKKTEIWSDDNTNR
ncbi:hypothetical protein L1987_23695 [Smallanthus sonchifolius]|uniref:Uncharacterized protein n=1 Tax=Smallanthus sonchifolius TaxID=185202 RepID=A0ACB9IJV6_9ASTR|nr:hypothetical protein L1987_23695 [Smallanthus sonchifolius]